MNFIVKAQIDKASDGSMIDTTTIRARRVRELLHQYSGKNILDVGCGEGHLLEPVAKQNRLVGIDVNPKVTEALKRGYIKVHCGSMEDATPFSNSEFDIVFAGECIEHVADTDAFLSEVSRVMDDRGKFILTTPNIRTLQSIARMLLWNLPPPAAAQYGSAHFRDWTTRLLKQVLKINGFKVDWMEGVDFTGHFPKLACHLPSLASDVIVQCSKLINNTGR